MTFIHKLDLYSVEIHQMCKYMNLVRQGFRKLSSDRHTDRHTSESIYHAALWAISNDNNNGSIFTAQNKLFSVAVTAVQTSTFSLLVKVCKEKEV